MRKTPFIGLTVLDPEDSLFSDNAAFTTRDRDEIDRALKLGVKTHRHTGLAGLANPAEVASATVLASGGTIDSGLTITVGYSLEDSAGGETLISPLTIVSTPVPMDVPPNAPLAEVQYTEGELLVDTFAYALTYIDGEGGETPLGPSVIVTRDPGFEKAQIKLTGLTDGMEAAGAVGWRLYRARGAGVYVFLTSGDESEDEFVDDGSTSPDCDTHPPTDNVNTTNKINRLQVFLPSGSAFEDATFINLYATLSNDFGESSLLAQYPVASAGASPIFEALEFLDSQPPDVNRSYGGANQIDPDTELIDWHWKRPVEKVGDLPVEGNEEGDIRALTDVETPTLYIFLNGEWQPLEFGGGGGQIDVLASGGIAPKVIEDPFDGVAIGPDWDWIIGAYEFEEDEDLAVSGGTIHPNAKAAKGAIYRTDALYTNDSFLFKFRIGSTLEYSDEIGVFQKWVDKDNYIELRLIAVEGFSTTNYEWFCFVGGEEIVFTTGTLENKLAVDTDYWLVSEVDGADLKVLIYDEDPEVGSPTPYETLEQTLGGPEEALIDIEGYPGFGLNGELDLTVDLFKMSIPGIQYADNVGRVVFVGSGGISVDVQEDGDDALVTLDAPLTLAGMGVIIITEAEKGIARPDDFRVYTWYCKVEPENLGLWDIWIEEGP